MAMGGFIVVVPTTSLNVFSHWSGRFAEFVPTDVTLYWGLGDG